MELKFGRLGIAKRNVERGLIPTHAKQLTDGTYVEHLFRQYSGLYPNRMRRPLDEDDDNHVAPRVPHEHVFRLNNLLRIHLRGAPAEPGPAPGGAAAGVAPTTVIGNAVVSLASVGGDFSADEAMDVRVVADYDSDMLLDAANSSAGLKTLEDMRITLDNVATELRLYTLPLELQPSRMSDEDFALLVDGSADACSRITDFVRTFDPALRRFYHAKGPGELRSEFGDPNVEGQKSPLQIRGDAHTFVQAVWRCFRDDDEEVSQQRQVC